MYNLEILDKNPRIITAWKQKSHRAFLGKKLFPAMIMFDKLKLCSEMGPSAKSSKWLKAQN